ncbi:hypothetical protein ACTXJ8_12625 [Corynebacterium variabile]|uniref:hypothetical protein n=1 Tax=Corynebacterium variabile TaxID=1727 RepID=UPI003FD2BD7B
MTIKEEINQLSIQEIRGYAMRGTPAERSAAREIIDGIEADGVKWVVGERKASPPISRPISGSSRFTVR